ncbi:DUF5684 domain-containing protein [Actinokineospora spheciospongiae]|uniref:DUF5684 domain-containing protein n=1 Tax=Actinokineospora spheciospongiae TaxID=909613 RepID=UPI000D97E1BB|nr:DUF5684 domain-containing protein [Actinokineospora spheciospongiae]PWW62522.1 hypothetical protein DFQ13_105337 [Actinokineospora spheciospongiae]
MAQYDVPTYPTTEFPWGALIGILAVTAVFAVIGIAAMWKIFTKAGEPGWAAIVPIYNTIVLLKISGKQTWWLIMFFIPVANIVFMILTLAGLSRSFGKDAGFTVLLVLLPFIGYPILGFGKAAYVGPGGIPRRYADYTQQGGYHLPQQHGYQQGY